MLYSFCGYYHLLILFFGGNMNLPKAKVIIILFFLLFLSGCAPKNEVVFHVNNTTFTEQFIDEVIELPDNPTRIGYRFMGWYLDENTWEEQILSDYKITDDMDIFAYFEKEYVVEFYVDGEIFHTDYVIDGEQISLPNNPTDQSYDTIDCNLYLMFCMVGLSNV
jgi:uncharacterized repeat protein (TIGR02543 family)